MKENDNPPVEMTDNQRRVFIDTVQLFEAYQAAFRDSMAFRGGMHWKKSKGRKYLFRSKDRYGYGKSLGPRNAETERILHEFQEGKQTNQKRLSALRERLGEQARFCKAAKIQRVPRIVARILRKLDQERLLERSVTVIGTNAIYAYEAAAGVFLDRPILATGDMDILWDVRSRLLLSMADGKPSQTGLIDILRKADRSFAPMKSQMFRAVNSNGYMVDLVNAEPRQIMARERRRMGDSGDLEADEIRNLQWLLSSPKFSHTVIGEDGYPARMVCPDPRGFALHKIWLSRQQDREPLKKKRDRHQAQAVAFLIKRYLLQYRFSGSELKMFPKSLFEEAEEVFSEFNDSEGFTG